MHIRLKPISLALAATTLLLSACATPPGKLEDADFVARNVEVQQSVPHSVSAFYEGLRYCGPSSGGVVLVTHHGVPDCAPPRPDGTAVCDLYAGASSGGRSDFILGRADFTPTPVGTTVILRVQNYAANKEAILSAWETFLHGNAKQVCPVK